MCKRVQAKKGKVLTTPEMLEDFKETEDQDRASKKMKNYQRNVIKTQVNVMNVKDHEVQEDMEISEKEDDTADSIIVHCGKHIQRRKRGLYSTHTRFPKCVPAVTDLDNDFNCFKCQA